MANSKKKFGVLIRGENFKMKVDGVKKTMGFYVARLVLAHTDEEAVDLAVEHVRQDKKLKRSVLNADNDPPLLSVDELAELSSWGDMKPPGSAFAFYPEKKAKSKLKTKKKTKTRTKTRTKRKSRK